MYDSIPGNMFTIRFVFKHFNKLKPLVTNFNSSVNGVSLVLSERPLLFSSIFKPNIDCGCSTNVRVDQSVVPSITPDKLLYFGSSLWFGGEERNLDDFLRLTIIKGGYAITFGLFVFLKWILSPEIDCPKELHIKLCNC